MSDGRCAPSPGPPATGWNLELGGGDAAAAEAASSVVWDAIERYNRELWPARILGAAVLAGGVVALGVLARSLAPWLSLVLGLPASIDPALAVLLFVGAILALGLAGAGARRHHAARHASGIAALGGSARAGRAWDAVWFLPYVTSRLIDMASRRELLPTAANVSRAAELLARGDDDDTLARVARQEGGARLRAHELLETVGLVGPRARRRGRSGGARTSAARDAGRRAARGVATRPQTEAPSRVTAPSRKPTGLRPLWSSAEADGAGHLYVAKTRGVIVVTSPREVIALDPDGALLWRMPRPDADPAGVPIDLVADGSRVLLLGANRLVRVVSVRDGSDVASFRSGAGVVAVALGGAGERVLLGDRLGNVYLVDGRGRPVGKGRVAHEVELVALNGDSSLAIAASRDGSVSVVLPGTFEVVQTFHARGRIERLWLDERGRRVFLFVPRVGLSSYDVVESDLATLQLDRDLVDADTDLAGEESVALTVDGRVVVVGDGARVLWQGEAPRGATAVRLDARADRLWVRDAAGVTRAFAIVRGDEAGRALELAPRPEAASEEVRLRAVAQPEPGGFRSLAVQAGSGRVAMLHPRGILSIMAADGAEAAHLEGVGGLDALRWADRGPLLVATADDRVRAVHDGRVVREVMAVAPRVVAVAGGDELVLCANGSDLHRVDAAGPRPLVRFPARVGALAALDLQGDPRIAVQVDEHLMILDGRGQPTFRGEVGALHRPPVVLAARGDAFVLGSGAGRMRVLGAGGEVLAERDVEQPIVDLLALPHGVLVTTRTGALLELDLELEVVGGCAPPPGFHRIGVDAHGRATLVTADGPTVVVRGLDGRTVGRYGLDDEPIDLATGPDGRWWVLTRLTLVRSPGSAGEASTGGAARERAAFLEL